MDEATARAGAELEALIRAKLAEVPRMTSDQTIATAIGLLPSMAWSLRKIDQLRAQRDAALTVLKDGRRTCACADIDEAIRILEASRG